MGDAVGDHVGPNGPQAVRANGPARETVARATTPLGVLSASTRSLWAHVQQRYLRERETGNWVNLRYIFSGYRTLDLAYNLSPVLFGALLAVAFATVYEAYHTAPALSLLGRRYRYNIIEAAVLLIALVAGVVVYVVVRRRGVFLVDYVTFLPPERLRVSYDAFMRLTAESGCFSQESMDFQMKLLHRSGVGEEAYFPAAMFQAKEIAAHGGNGAAVLNMQSAREEAEMVLFTVVEQLLRKTHTRARDIDILIVNCSLFNPTPSLSAMLVNRFQMKSSVRTYNLAGMGCSAGLIAKYALLHTVRTHRGGDDPAYGCIYQEEDKAGIRGVRLSKQIMEVAGEAVRENIFRLGPLVFPVDVHVRFFTNLLRRRYLRQRHLKPYVPDFHRAFDHFCIHTGGRAVIDTLESSLKLTPQDVAPSRYALERFGNTSSASIWYELQYLERNGKMRRGHRTWQIAFGSGFKCNSAVWKALRHIRPDEAAVYATTE
ncbi:hypothetical protein CDCA_CDCA03G1021 [Cyanidium caldarium]|uniref:3-ketoacyl-CoA synthase n=1 Tax=Cyanidium caldarium TaxID=2771 RepID=A0AAV9IS37_CYACA|nr:hypothetical protein CDCA_CDCA03G1021 [Cyanidium caldarium]